MDKFTAHTVTLPNGETTRYYEGGSPTGTPFIFIHGWPDIAESWIHQLTHFASTGRYRVIAPDMRGYGHSSAPRSTEAYSLRELVSELVSLAKQLDISRAIWCAHDWGCGVVNALAAHHPSLFHRLINLAVPYRTIELGLAALKPHINRSLYPEPDFEWGPFDYMRYYELAPEQCIAMFESPAAPRITKVLYARADPHSHGKRAFSSQIIAQRGWFAGDADAHCPDLPLAATCLASEAHYEHLLASQQRHGFFGPTAYYLNHERNAAYAREEVNAGVLPFPVLFIDAKLDAICSPSVAPGMADAQRSTCRDLTYETVEAGHWVHLEKPGEVNALMERWLEEKKDGLAA